MPLKGASQAKEPMCPPGWSLTVPRQSEAWTKSGQGATAGRAIAPSEGGAEVPSPFPWQGDRLLVGFVWGAIHPRVLWGHLHMGCNVPVYNSSVV